MEKGQLEHNNQKSNTEGEYLPIPKRICRQPHMYDNPKSIESTDNSIVAKFKSVLESVLININK
ncbi:hypothetical protein RT723_09760 [Psychrosphaera aquimarina]|uniref:Uncharacterized protein n=1 Tax=Psychrosphaera aquimarina TaxID=2044854 RepID=A0ABU3R0R1_9GAMM|nr:hypothetical protein [Psychrosphaera aquimarina]MDU0113274.1 hypothetical protein [Psychrosphaera aquimarina]